jgi:PelA/Pel-15E family pectate lyase
MNPARFRRRFYQAIAFALSLQSASAADFPQDLLRQSKTWYQGEDGRKTTACILSWQSPNGTWPKAKKTTQELRSGPREKIKGTFDNKSTTDELRYLARAIHATDDAACKQAFLLGLDHILEAQYANGGWPQSFPLEKKGYSRHITFNDNSMIRLMNFLQEVTAADTYAFVPEPRKRAAAAAVTRGIDCILKCQIIRNGKPSVWCAQHDAVSFAPAQARSYELPSLSGSESAGIVRFLMSLENPSPACIAAVKHAVAWFESSKIEGIRIDKINGDRQVIPDPKAAPLWARFYDLESGRPFFCDRDGIKKSNFSDIGRERRNGYAWYGTWGDSVAKEYRKWPHR